MLQVIRDRAQGFFAWLIVGGIILSFALWGINSYFQDDSAGNQAATVNEMDISLYEYQIAYQNERSRMQQMFGENFDADLFDDQIKNSALDRVIDNAVLMQEAMEAGMTVSDAQLMRVLQGIDAFQEEGKFSKAAYEQALRSSGEPSPSFEARIRRSLLADQLIRGIASTGIVTSKDVETLTRLQNQEREIAYLIVSADKYKKDVKLDDAQIDAHYRENQESYKTPEQVQLEYVELSVDALREGVEVTDEEAENYYEEQKERFQAPEERKARHILIEGSDDAAKQKAQEVYDKIIAGEDFAKLAKEHSQDPGSASDGGMLDFFGRGIMDSSFEEAAFSLKVGEVSKPVLSQFGYHIIKLEDVRGGGEKPFESVKAGLVNELKRNKAERLYFEKVEKLANLAYEIPDSLTPVKEELGLTIKSTPYFGRNGGPGIAGERKVISAAFSDEVLQERLNSEAIELGESHSVVLRVKDYKPAEVRPLEQVKSRIENELRTKLAQEKAEEVGKSLLAKAREGDALGKLAKAENHEFKDAAWYKRNDTKANNEVLKVAFATSRPEEKNSAYKGASLANGDYAVIAVKGVKDGDISSLSEADKDEQMDTLGNAAGIDEFSFMLKELKDDATIKRYPANL